MPVYQNKLCAAVFLAVLLSISVTGVMGYFSMKRDIIAQEQHWITQFQSVTNTLVQSVTSITTLTASISNTALSELLLTLQGANTTITNARVQASQQGNWAVVDTSFNQLQRYIIFQVANVHHCSATVLPRRPKKLY